jgi:hypothetical protein
VAASSVAETGGKDCAAFKREIAPKLDAFSLKEIGQATGLSLAACSRSSAARSKS